MKLTFFHLENAHQSLKSTRMRTFLTIIGVAIGVASITAILALSNGVTDTVRSQISNLDGNIAVIQSGVVDKDSQDVFKTSSENSTIATLTEQDVVSIAKLPNIQAVAPIMKFQSSLKTDENSLDIARYSVMATSSDFINTTELKLRDGQFIDGSTAIQTAVVGEQLAVDLFGTADAIGQNFQIKDQTFTVIGIASSDNNPINYNNVDYNYTAIISLSSAKKFTSDVAQIQQINFTATSVDKLSQLTGDVEKVITENHGGDKDFTLIGKDSVANSTSTMFSAMTTVSVMIASVSLLVGGVGIMNILLVNVAERTREIGIRKSVGASNYDILWQFLLESLAISLVGGFVGYIAGYMGAFILSSGLPFTPSFSWDIILIATALSLGVGGLFGIYPAILAANKDPIESLRQYE